LPKHPRLSIGTCAKSLREKDFVSFGPFEGGASPSLEKGPPSHPRSTGIPKPGKMHDLKWTRERFPGVVQGHAGLCLAQRIQAEKLLLLVGMSVGGGYASVPLLGARAPRSRTGRDAFGGRWFRFGRGM